MAKTTTANPFYQARRRAGIAGWAFAVFRLGVRPDYFRELERGALDPVMAMPALRKLARVTGAALVPLVESYARSREAAAWVRL